MCALGDSHTGPCEWVRLPKRIQRQRTKGWRMPAGAVYVGRPSIWANPFRVGARLAYPYAVVFEVETVPNRAVAVELFRAYTRITPGYDLLVERLRGKDLVCWCPLADPCHADVLLELANRTVSRA